MNESSLSKDELREAAAAYRAANSNLEFPASRDPGSSAPRLNPAEYVAWCEEMRLLLKLPGDQQAERLALKTAKEFVL